MSSFLRYFFWEILFWKILKHRYRFIFIAFTTTTFSSLWLFCKIIAFCLSFCSKVIRISNYLLILRVDILAPTFIKSIRISFHLYLHLHASINEYKCIAIISHYFHCKYSFANSNYLQILSKSRCKCALFCSSPAYNCSQVNF